MIQCKGCGFSVNELMRFALMKNVCPSCGSGLLSAKDSNIISIIQGRVNSQRFSSGLTESQVYDLSLFIFNELKDGFGKMALDLRKASRSDDLSNDNEEDGDEVIQHSEEPDLNDIRKQIAAEFSGNTNDAEEEDEYDSEDDEDALSKAERLKRLHQQRVSSNPRLLEGVPATVRRNGFKGVTRSG